MRRHVGWGTALLCAAAALAAFPGCGSGGGSSAGLAGVVTDAEGQAVAGARVTSGGASTVSLSNGSFTMSVGGTGYRTVRAESTIGGRRWSGETRVDLVKGEQNRSVNIVVSDERYQGAVAGRVVDQSGFGFDGAKVFVGGPLGSTLAITDRSGNYEVGRLTPGFTYTVTASFAGYLNDTRTVSVTANQTSALSFALAASNPQGAIPAPRDVSAQAWTIAATITRADDPARGLYEWLKHVYRRKRGLPDGPVARVIERKGAGRVTPADSVIEVDLFWEYDSYNDLFGYAVKRGTAANPSRVVAVLRDPLAAAFFDLDSALSPYTRYHYTVHGLDTIDFPDNGLVGPGSADVAARPLGRLHAEGPIGGAQVTPPPLLQWSAVSGADTYQVYVFDQFPDLQNADDPNGVAPIWPEDIDRPGSSLVNAPTTSVRYAGPALRSGRTYYWLVVASDVGGEALSASQLERFVAR
ncbi:MAG: carboxypeptidase regulatory-like domain-containing protein [Chthonomonadales bacterium]|nr:carboxypeptidase regulatory-like domain-containing protein [Chthonomonadales bacterium]